MGSRKPSGMMTTFVKKKQIGLNVVPGSVTVATAEERVAFNPRVPPFEDERDHFLVTVSEPKKKESTCWTRTAVSEAILKWHEILGARASYQALAATQTGRNPAARSKTSLPICRADQWT